MHLPQNEPRDLERDSRCLSRHEIAGYANGGNIDLDWDRLSSHLETCSRCEALIDEVTEQSVINLPALAALPPTAEDEPEFVELHAQLLANPLTFTGDETIDEMGGVLEDDPFRIDVLPVDVDRYRLLEAIGSGATGTVYRAKHLELDREVAIKILSQRRSLDHDSVERFRKEIRAVGKLKHPNIVGATDAGDVDGRHYLVMEYAAGSSLSSIVQDHKRLPAPIACEVIRQAALGLACAHENRMVHRDIKPSNLLLTENGVVKLLDLGLVAFESGDDASATTNEPRGTADYMSPEQWTRYDEVDGRSDVYSLGCTLFKLLTGRAPFHPLPEECFSKREAHIEHAPLSLASLECEAPAALQDTLNRMLAKDPSERIGSAATVAKQMARFTRGADLNGVVSGKKHLLKRTPIYSRRSFLYTVTGLVVGAGLGNWLLHRRRRPAVATNAWRSIEPTEPFFLRHFYPDVKDASSDATDNANIDATEATETNKATESPETPNKAKALPPSVDFFEVKEGVTTIAGNDDVLLHFGRPTRGVFSLQTTIVEEGHRNGLFFGYQSTLNDTMFDSIRVLRDDKGSVRIVWSEHRFGITDGVPFQEDLPLAEALIKDAGQYAEKDIDSGTSGSTERQFTIEATVGSNGIPEVTFEGRQLADGEWTLSSEGRQRQTLAPNLRRSKSVGRLGIVCGATHIDIQNTKLKYHAN